MLRCSSEYGGKHAPVECLNTENNSELMADIATGHNNGSSLDTASNNEENSTIPSASMDLNLPHTNERMVNAIVHNDESSLDAVSNNEETSKIPPDSVDLNLSCTNEKDVNAIVHNDESSSDTVILATGFNNTACINMKNEGNGDILPEQCAINQELT